MASIELNPKPYIYAPPFMLFGGVNVNCSNKNDSLIDDLEHLTSELNNSIIQAYDIRSRISKHEFTIENVIQPLNKMLERGCNDFSFGDKYQSLSHIYKNIVEQGKEAGIFIGKEDYPITQVYFLTLLKDEFNAEIIKNFIGGIQIVSIRLSCKSSKFDSSISNDKLRITTEVIRQKDKNYFI